MSLEEFRGTGRGRVFLYSLPPLRCLPAQVEEVSEANISCGFRDLPAGAAASGGGGGGGGGVGNGRTENFNHRDGLGECNGNDPSAPGRSPGGGLTLRRTKPLYEYRNTLDHTMGLRIGAKKASAI